jgi:hypothetical protein
VSTDSNRSLKPEARSPGGSARGRGWTRFLFYRKEVLKTTWALRLLGLACLVALPWLTRGFWAGAVGRGLVCDEQQPVGAAVGAVIVENFDVNYLVFERAGDLRRNGLTAPIIVPVQASPASAEPNLVSAGIVEVMARIARVGELTMVPVRETEPISLNTAYQVRDFLRKNGIQSVLVLAPALRSRRSSLIYGTVLGPAGISMRCSPVFGGQTPETWLDTWHGVELVLEQYLKLEYYRFFILPRARATSG